MADLENRLRYFVRNIVAVDKWPFRFGYSYRGVVRFSKENLSRPRERERDVSAHCFSADLSTVTRDRENARVEIIFDVLSMDNRGGCTEGRISCDSSCLRGPLFFF